MSDLVIDVQDLSKAYRIWDKPVSRLTVPLMEAAANILPGGEWMKKRAATRYQDFWALKGISFTVRRGEAVGVIGRNGSGKSTLLEIIAGTLQPTSGSVEVQGRVAALLELGSGFNPDFTGRENVYLNGAVLGFSRAEIDERFDSIAAFADIGNFLDQPTKTYSSGMAIRLAFAVAVSVEPEILIVDEALSVGDVFFQQKCFKRVHQILDQGTSLLFVSHDTGAVQNLCHRAILLKDGLPAFDGPPEEAASRYYTQSGEKTSTGRIQAADRIQTEAESERLEAARQVLELDNLSIKAKSRHGSGELEILAATLCDDRGNPTLAIQMERTATIVLKLKARTIIAEPNVGIHLYDRMSNLVFCSSSRQLGGLLRSFETDEERIVEINLELTVQPGQYTFSLGCSEPSVDGPNAGFQHDRIEGLGPLEVWASDTSIWAFYGAARLPMKVTELC